MANDDKDLRLLFECDPVKNTECTKEGCYIFGGDCSWTTKPECSKDGTIGFTIGEKLKDGTIGFTIGDKLTENIE